jgi:hypothetical protein
MKHHENLPRINISPSLPVNKKPEDTYREVKDAAKSGSYTKVISLVDLDTYLKEDRETGRGEKSNLAVFEEYYNELTAIENVHVLINCPCFEFWILLHYRNTGKFFSKCSKVETEVKKELPGYEKTEKFYKKRNNDIYQKLKDNQPFACTRAENLGNFSFENCHTAKAEVFKVLMMVGIG